MGSGAHLDLIIHPHELDGVNATAIGRIDFFFELAQGDSDNILAGDNNVPLFFDETHPCQIAGFRSQHDAGFYNGFPLAGKRHTVALLERECWCHPELPSLPNNPLNNHIAVERFLQRGDRQAITDALLDPKYARGDLSKCVPLAFAEVVGVCAELFFKFFGGCFEIGPKQARRHPV